MPHVLVTALACALSISTATSASAGPISRDEHDRQTATMEQLKQSLSDQASATKKLALIFQAVRVERDPNFRRRLLGVADNTLPAPERETFYTELLANDPDAGVRSDAATALGRTGSEQALASLARSARSDATTIEMRGDVGGHSSARRAAIFAIAELARRHPALADDATVKLRALPAEYPPPDNQGLADARLQALYQITHDAALLKPFYDRLKSDTPRERENGVIAFRYLKLSEAPSEVIAAVTDPDVGVRQWAALTLGEIGDPKAAPTLMELAANPKQDAGVRCNAIFSLGLFQSPVAGKLMEKLLTDPDPRIQTGAAIAVYRITGKKVAQFPAGYDADGPKAP